MSRVCCSLIQRSSASVKSSALFFRLFFFAAAEPFGAAGAGVARTTLPIDATSKQKKE